MPLEPNPKIDLFKNITPTVLPLFWIEEVSLKEKDGKSMLPTNIEITCVHVTSFCQMSVLLHFFKHLISVCFRCEFFKKTTMKILSGGRIEQYLHQTVKKPVYDEENCGSCKVFDFVGIDGR